MKTKNTIYKVSGNHNSIKMECENMNHLAKKIFNYFNLMVEIVSFERTRNSIHYQYKIKNSLDIHNGYLGIMREMGGYSKEGIAYKIK